MEKRCVEGRGGGEEQEDISSSILPSMISGSESDGVWYVSAWLQLATTGGVIQYVNDAGGYPLQPN